MYILKDTKNTAGRHRMMKESQSLEYTWTLLPTLVLLAIGIPSLRLLYLVDEAAIGNLTVKALGHQWYWHYEYPGSSSFDSYLNVRPYRLLDSENRLSIPILQGAQMLITAADVLHSWTIPSMGIKADAVPGRVNKLSLRRKRVGVYYGQCSEICGRNHRFIPIAMETY